MKSYDKDFIIGLDPGVKYVGVASGWQDRCYGIQLNLEKDLRTVFSIVEQHWDLIEWIFYYHFSDKVTNSNCHINIEIDETGEQKDGIYSEVISSICSELKKRLNEWQDIGKLSYSTYTGLETYHKRRELNLNKTKYKGHKNIMAHINDARALWALGFGKRYSEWSGACELVDSPDYIEYYEWNSLLVDDFLDPFKMRAIAFSTRLSDSRSKHVVDPKLVELCTNKNTPKIDFLRYLENSTKEIPTEKDPMLARVVYENEVELEAN